MRPGTDMDRLATGPLAGAMVAGTFQIIDFSDVRSSAGQAWDDMEAYARRLLAEELANSLGPRDIYQRVEGLTFVVCFGEADQASAAALAEGVAARVRSRLFAELPAVADRLGVGRFVAEVDRGLVLGSGPPVAKALLAGLETIRKEVIVAERTRATLIVKDARVMFQPSWAPTLGRTTINRCVLDPLLSRSIVDYIGSTQDTAVAQSVLADLDCVVFAKAVAGVHGSARGVSSIAPVAIPVQYSTLRDADTCDRYLSLVAALPEPYRRSAVLEIMTSGRWNGPELMPLLRQLRQIGCQTMLRVSSALDAQLITTGDDLWAISFDIGRADSAGVTNLARRAGAYGLKSLAVGANTLGDLDKAQTAGFDMIVGSAVHLTQDTPKLPIRYNPRSARAQQGLANGAPGAAASLPTPLDTPPQ